MTDIATLRKLLAEATPGPWDEDTCLIQACAFSGGHAHAEFIEPTDATLIVALRNAAPALLDELERLRAEAAEATYWGEMTCEVTEPEADCRCPGCDFRRTESAADHPGLKTLRGEEG